jgi:hypothetical protein
MRGIGTLSLGHTAIALALGLGAAPAAQAQQTGSGQVVVDGDDIGGVVRGPNGPEAGVWVIAETNDLLTKFARIVVTDDAGAMLSLTCQGPDTKSGCAATGSPMRQRRMVNRASFST